MKWTYKENYDWRKESLTVTKELWMNESLLKICKCWINCKTYPNRRQPWTELSNLFRNKMCQWQTRYSET